jgi:hypothetical protein
MKYSVIILIMMPSVARLEKNSQKPYKKIILTVFETGYYSFKIFVCPDSLNCCPENLHFSLARGAAAPPPAPLPRTPMPPLNPCNLRYGFSGILSLSLIFFLGNKTSIFIGLIAFYILNQNHR